MDITAKLTGFDSIEIKMSAGFWTDKTTKFNFYEDGKFVSQITPINIAKQGNVVVFSLHVRHEFTPGKYYEVSDAKNSFAPIDLSFLASTKQFEERYRYDGELGAIYSKEKTIFRLFSPLANILFVGVKKDDGSFDYYKMKRLESGVFEAEVNRDLEGKAYMFTGTVNGKQVSAPDPYGFSVNTNSRLTYVVDEKKVKTISLNREKLPPFKSYSKAIIYELDVRDMTSLTQLSDAGKYTALAKEGLKTKSEKLSIGLDYIAGLGVTHVQILPVYDFQTIDDLHSNDTYNWGYDPLFWFSPEGSYSTDPDDPYKRIVELRNLVSKFHERGIRVNMDVVFNHVFDRDTNPLEILCPGYYFRKYKDGSYSNGSFCGNDFNSTCYMGAKLLIDALKHYVEWFGVDGFRFDLMGLLDLNTMNRAVKEIRALLPDAMFYGEGWDMNTALPSERRTTIGNASQTPDIGFFCDVYRDASKGATSDDRLSERGYLLGDNSKLNDFKFAFSGSCLFLGRNPLFVSPTQSINYVECHDNHTLWDKLKASCSTDSDAERLNKIKFITGLTILSFGVPFIHMGQEVGLSKGMMGNSFCAGDKVNGMDYVVAENRLDLYEYTRSIIAFKKNHPELTFDNKEAMIDSSITFMPMANGGVIIKVKVSKGLYYFVVNNQRDQITYTFPNYVKVVLTETGGLPEHADFFSQTIIVKGFSFIVCFANNEDPAI